MLQFCYCTLGEKPFMNVFVGFHKSRINERQLLFCINSINQSNLKYLHLVLKYSVQRNYEVDICQNHY